MIVDTSALIAILQREDSHGTLRSAIYHEADLILPAPSRLEFLTTARGSRCDLAAEADVFLQELAQLGMTTLSWTDHHAAVASEAQRR